MFFKSPLENNPNLVALQEIYVSARDEVAAHAPSLPPQATAIRVLQWQETNRTMIFGEHNRHTYVTVDNGTQTVGLRVSHYTGEAAFVATHVKPEKAFKEGHKVKGDITPATAADILMTIKMMHKQAHLSVPPMA